MFVAKIVILDIYLREEIQFFFEKITYFRVKSANLAYTWNSLIGKKTFQLRSDFWVEERCVCAKTENSNNKKSKIILKEKKCIGADLIMLRNWCFQLKKIVKIFIRPKSKSIS